jgi:hypothetical protein
VEPSRVIWIGAEWRPRSENEGWKCKYRVPVSILLMVLLASAVLVLWPLIGMARTK